MNLEEANSANKSTSLISKFIGDSAFLLALIPFSFSLIVFMYEVGRFYYFDIPFEYISISIGEVFAVWSALFIALGVFGFTILDTVINVITGSKVTKVLFAKPLIYAVVCFLFIFPINPKYAFYFTLIILTLNILTNLIRPLFNKDKSKTYLERVESTQIEVSKSKSSEGLSIIGWKKFTENYYLWFISIYLIFGIPCRVGYMIEEHNESHWVDSSDETIILVGIDNDYYLLKEYDPKSKELKDGYKIRPISNREATFHKIKTGKLKDRKPNSKT